MKKKLKQILKLDKKGREVVDPRPVSIPLKFRNPPSTADEIRRQIRHEMSMYAESKGEETFEEADDFDVDDDFDPTSPWEMSFDQEVYTGQNLMKEETPMEGSSASTGDDPDPQKSGESPESEVITSEPIQKGEQKEKEPQLPFG